jgi:hypothetical protein
MLAINTNAMDVVQVLVERFLIRTNVAVAQVRCRRHSPVEPNRASHAKRVGRLPFLGRERSSD